ncbi:MAG: hypothetical protein GX222_01300 [Ruminococcaceae bacterium]|nr:hypothetical protein [Oscillospiraceae bacterium]
MKKIKYLLKFTSEYDYAKTLLEGKLFMNQASYYHNLEVGQGDIREGSFSNESMAYVGTSYPIYCLYAAYEHQLVDNSIIVPEKLATDFQAKYVTVIKFDEFMQMLKNNELGTEYGLTVGEVNYRYLSIEDSHEMLKGEKNSLLYKTPNFKYQQEFRIIVHENLEPITKKEVLDGMEVECIIGYEHKIYSLKRDLQGIAKIIKLDECKCVDGNMIISLNQGIL